MKSDIFKKDLFGEIHFFQYSNSKEPYASFSTQPGSPITFSDVFDGLLVSRAHTDSQAALLSRSLVEKEMKLVSS